jgi:hypothetical protein
MDAMAAPRFLGNAVCANDEVGPETGLAAQRL